MGKVGSGRARVMAVGGERGGTQGNHLAGTNNMVAAALVKQMAEVRQRPARRGTDFLNGT